MYINRKWPRIFKSFSFVEVKSHRKSLIIMKCLVFLTLACLVCSCLAGYRNYNQYFPSSYISRYAYGGKYNVPGTYNYGYPQRYAYAEKAGVYDYAVYPGVPHYV